MPNEANWLLQAISNWSAANAENSYSSLPALITQYYNSHGVNTDNPEGQSEINAATRGARYAQEGRINAIRSQRGEAAFDPMAAPLATAPSQDPNYHAPAPAYTPPINQGPPPTPSMVGGVYNGQMHVGLSNVETPYAPPGYQTTPAAPGYSFAPAPDGSSSPSGLSQANSSVFGADANALQGQMSNLKNYLTTRYTGAAKAAGTLGNTNESKAGVEADVNAGMPGAQLALQGQLDTAQQGATGVNPTPSTAQSTAPSQAPAPSTTPGVNEPKVAPTDASGLISGGAPMKSANRLKALQQKVTNGR